MRKFFGAALLLVGVLLVGGALTLFVYNQRQTEQAQQTASELLESVKTEIYAQKPAQPQTTESEIPNIYDTTMKEVPVNGHASIGYLSIPDVGLELPVLSRTDDDLLKIAPCRFSGTLLGEDLVIGAHNYDSSFGRLHRVTLDTPVFFTDVDGQVWSYRVAEVETLMPDESERLCEGVYPLTLYTCTYGGQSRITLRCDWLNPE